MIAACFGIASGLRFWRSGKTRAGESSSGHASLKEESPGFSRRKCQIPPPGSWYVSGADPASTGSPLVLLASFIVACQYESTRRFFNFTQMGYALQSEQKTSHSVF